MWTVFFIGSVGLKRQMESIYGTNYLPRKYHYKRDAMFTIERLKAHGFNAGVEKTKDYEARIAEMRDSDVIPH